MGDSDRSREAEGGQGQRGSSASCLRYFHSTTQMLVVVILIFLLIEIPVAVMFLLHFAINLKLLSASHYGWINTALVFRSTFPPHPSPLQSSPWLNSRNLLVLVSYPFNFGELAPSCRPVERRH